MLNVIWWLLLIWLVKIVIDLFIFFFKIDSLTQLWWFVRSTIFSPAPCTLSITATGFSCRHPMREFVLNLISPRNNGYIIVINRSVCPGRHIETIARSNIIITARKYEIAVYRRVNVFTVSKRVINKIKKN